jgi:hypothetical protein
MPEEKEKRLLRELEGKNIEHYSVLLSAWIATKMERDKTLITLAAAAIGLLITILTTVGAINILVICLFAFAILAFIITIWSALEIYQLNSKHIEDALRGSSERDPKLEKYDKISTSSFLIGVFSALLIGTISAGNKLFKMENINMAKQDQNTSNTIFTGDSLNGLSGLNPQNIEIKSLNGLGNLSPASVQPSSQPQEQNDSSLPSNPTNSDTKPSN